jgi:hypothetical protein
MSMTTSMWQALTDVNFGNATELPNIVQVFEFSMNPGGDEALWIGVSIALWRRKAW